MKSAMQKKQQKAGRMRGIVAYQIQLRQKDVQLHGPRHLKAAIEQHAGMLSSVVTKAKKMSKKVPTDGKPIRVSSPRLLQSGVCK